MKKTKLLFVLHDISNAGIERVCLCLLNRLDKDAFKISVLLYNHKGRNALSDKLPEKVTYYNYNCGNTRNKFLRILQIGKIIISCIKNERPDIVMSFIPFINTVVFFVNRFFHFKHIASQHSLLSNDASLLRGASKIYSVILWKFVYKHIKHFVVVSEVIRQDLILNFGVGERYVKVIYNGIDLDAINNFLLEKTKIPVKEYVLFVGRIEIEKSVDTLIEAFAITRNRNPDLHLVLMGDGSLLPKMKLKSKELGCEAVIHFIGFQSNPFIYMRNAVCLVLPSIFEGFGCVLIEAMACGTPVIASDIEGPKEIIKNMENGLLFKPRDSVSLAEKIEMVVNRENLRQSLIKNGFITIKQFLKMPQEYALYLTSIKKEDLYES